MENWEGLRNIIIIYPEFVYLRLSKRLLLKVDGGWRSQALQK